MAPANEGLRADQFAAAEMDLWLVEQFEFAPLGGERKLDLERQSGLEFLSDAGFEQHIAAALAGLGSAKRKMAVGEQFVRIAAVGGVVGRTDRDLDAVRTATGGHRRVKTGHNTFGQFVDAC